MLKMEIRAISQDFVTLLLNFEAFEQLYEGSQHDQDDLTPTGHCPLDRHTIDRHDIPDSDDNNKLLELIDSSSDEDVSTWESGCNVDSTCDANKQDDTTTAVPPGGQHCDTRMLPPGAQHRHDRLLQNVSDILAAPDASVVDNSPTDQTIQLNSTAIAHSQTWNVTIPSTPLPIRLYQTPVSGFLARHSSDTLSSADESTPIVNVRSGRYNRSACEDSTPTMTEESLLCRVPFIDRHISGFSSTDWLQGSESVSVDDTRQVYLDKTESDEEGHTMQSGANAIDRITSSLEATLGSEPNISTLTTPSSEGTKSSDVTSSSIHFSPATSCVESSYKESDGAASRSASPHSNSRCRLHRVLQRNISRDRLLACMARQRYLVSSSTGVSSDDMPLNAMPPPTNSPDSNVSPASNETNNNDVRQLAVPFGTRPPCIGKEATPEGVAISTNGATEVINVSDVFTDRFIIPAECKYNNAYGVNFTSVTTQQRTPKRHHKMHYRPRTATSAGKKNVALASGGSRKKPALLRRIQNWGRQLRNGSRHNPAHKGHDPTLKDKDREVEEEL